MISSYGRFKTILNKTANEVVQKTSMAISASFATIYNLPSHVYRMACDVGKAATADPFEVFLSVGKGVSVGGFSGLFLAENFDETGLFAVRQRLIQDFPNCAYLINCQSFSVLMCQGDVDILAIKAEERKRLAEAGIDRTDFPIKNLPIVIGTAAFVTALSLFHTVKEINGREKGKDNTAKHARLLYITNS